MAGEEGKKIIIPTDGKGQAPRLIKPPSDMFGGEVFILDGKYYIDCPKCENQGLVVMTSVLASIKPTVQGTIALDFEGEAKILFMCTDNKCKHLFDMEDWMVFHKERQRKTLVVESKEDGQSEEKGVNADDDTRELGEDRGQAEEGTADKVQETGK